MFGLFSKKEKPKTALDALIIAMYGNPLPAIRVSRVLQRVYRLLASNMATYRDNKLSR